MNTRCKIYFSIGLVLKVVVSLFFASFFLTDLFIPFVSSFSGSLSSNPYEVFLGQSDYAHFPYPALMLYILTFFKIIFGWCLPDLIVFRLPLIIADIAIFAVIYSWLKHRHIERLIWCYWLSPVLFYISYIHGQLDVIPIAFLFGSLFFLFKDQNYLSSLMLGLSIASKTSMVLVVPLFVIFLFSKNKRIFELVNFVLIIGATFFITNLQFIFDPAFHQMVFCNHEQNKIFDSFLTLNNLKFYIIPSVLLMIFAYSALIKHYNKDIFISFLGFAFAALLIFIPPMPGWYFWLIPFLVCFYVKEDGRSPYLFLGLQVFYIAYFTVVAFNAPSFIVNVAFTCLQATLFINCLCIYKRGVEKFGRQKLLASPFLVGIGGNSGAGKSTIANALEALFTSVNTTVLRGDDMHKWCRGHEKWHQLTHLDPKANNLHQEIHTLKKLKLGRKVSRSIYNHVTGMFEKPTTVKPKSLIVFEGLHPFYLPALCDLYDLKIFVRPEKRLETHWKLVRDSVTRGYSSEMILKSIKLREEDFKQYIDSQRDKANIILEPRAKNEIVNLGDPESKVEVVYKVNCTTDAYLEPILEALHIPFEYRESSLEFVIDGSYSHEDLINVAKNYLSTLDDLGVMVYSIPEGNFGALILILTFYIFDKANNDV